MIVGGGWGQSWGKGGRNGGWAAARSAFNPRTTRLKGWAACRNFRGRCLCFLHGFLGRASPVVGCAEGPPVVAADAVDVEGPSNGASVGPSDATGSSNRGCAWSCAGANVTGESLRRAGSSRAVGGAVSSTISDSSSRDGTGSWSLARRDGPARINGPRGWNGEGERRRRLGRRGLWFLEKLRDFSASLEWKFWLVVV